MRILSAILFCFVAAMPARAEPRTYTLDPAQTRVEFTWYYGKTPVTGTIPILNADVVIDFQDQSNSAVNAVLDASRIQAGFFFATQALTGPKMFNTEKWPEITFESTSVEQNGTVADLTGNLTLRGKSRRVRMRAELFKQQGAETGDLSKLAILIQSTLNRMDYGAGGWAKDVGPKVDLEIRAYLELQG
jgi:polyisoprenoid-binding protein YceI